MRPLSASARWTRRQVSLRRTNHGLAAKTGHRDPVIVENDQGIKTRIPRDEKIHPKLRRRDARDPSRNGIAKARKIASGVSGALTNGIGKTGANRHRQARMQAVRNWWINRSNGNPRHLAKNSGLSR